jgi:hypothetical protein
MFRLVLISGASDGRTFTYTPGPADATGRIETYRIDVRPVRFGYGYTRSYLCDPQGRLFFTDDDRRAEPSDPNLELDPALAEERPSLCVGERPTGKAKVPAPDDQVERRKQHDDAERRTNQELRRE